MALVAPTYYAPTYQAPTFAAPESYVTIIFILFSVFRDNLRTHIILGLTKVIRGPFI